jgi:hypothetical protein
MAPKFHHDRLEQKPAMTAMVDDFIGNVAADKPTNKSFANANIPAWHEGTHRRPLNRGGERPRPDRGLRRLGAL